MKVRIFVLVFFSVKKVMLDINYNYNCFFVLFVKKCIYAFFRLKGRRSFLICVYLFDRTINIYTAILFTSLFVTSLLYIFRAGG